MAGRFQRRFSVPADDLQRLMNCIVEHAEPADTREVERLLGALTSLAARLDAHSGGDPVSFTPPRGTAHLVERALEGMARSDRHASRARRMASRATRHAS